jgi:hypothetical protein
MEDQEIEIKQDFMIANWSHESVIRQAMISAPKFDNVFDASKYFVEQGFNIMICKSGNEHMLFVDSGRFRVFR